jgi:hypothetical protein
MRHRGAEEQVQERAPAESGGADALHREVHRARRECESCPSMLPPTARERQFHENHEQRNSRRDFRGRT